MLKKRLKDFLTWNIVTPAADLANEAVFQGIFDAQCRNLGIRNDFYPVGGAASHGMLYLLARLLTEDRLRDIVEFGSGQSTLLIDRIRPEGGFHLCFEADAHWHGQLARRLSRCDYQLVPLESRVIESLRVQTYQCPPRRDFDLMLVDGPPGTDRFSRFGCVEWIITNRRESFVVIIDDTNRRGEHDTVRWLEDWFKGMHRPVFMKQLRGRTVQTILALGDMQHVAYYS